jgi:uncharacterized damage-inducible protein DinB
MIDNQFIKMMANYNQWQNESLYSSADLLGNEARKLQRGAFFGSIHHTLCHVLWGDMIWTSRFAELAAPEVNSIQQSGLMIEDWQELKELRYQRDREIISWADGLDHAVIEGELSWYSGALKANASRPLGEILVHFFNHQTHHRGQVHAMITAAGGQPDDTDLFVMSMR